MTIKTIDPLSIRNAIRRRISAIRNLAPLIPVDTWTLDTRLSG